MVNWEQVAIPEVKTINTISHRAVDILGITDLLSLQMDITAAHLSCPLDLDALLAADDKNFLHDVVGICRHINRNTGKLENCFVPRYAKKPESD